MSGGDSVKVPRSVVPCWRSPWACEPHGLLMGMAPSNGTSVRLEVHPLVVVPTFVINDCANRP
jgi:hypothetical protein